MANSNNSPAAAAFHKRKRKRKRKGEAKTAGRDPRDTSKTLSSSGPVSSPQSKHDGDYSIEPSSALPNQVKTKVDAWFGEGGSHLQPIATLKLAFAVVEQYASTRPVDISGDVHTLATPARREKRLPSHSSKVATGRDVDEFFVRWAGGKKQFEDLLHSWWKEHKLFTTNKMSYWGIAVLVMLRAFVQVRKDVTDRSLKGGDDRFIAVRPHDVFWWLQNDVDLENDVPVPKSYRFKQQRARSNQLIRYIELVVGDRTNPCLVTSYEEKVRSYRSDKMEPWSGDLVAKIVETAKRVRDSERDELQGIETGLPLTHEHFKTAILKVLPPQGLGNRRKHAEQPEQSASKTSHNGSGTGRSPSLRPRTMTGKRVRSDKEKVDAKDADEDVEEEEELLIQRPRKKVRL